MPITLLQARVQLPDPQDCTDNADTLALLEAVFDPLVRRGGDGRFEPAVAESWRVSEDARTWWFTLRPDLRFHDGAPLDAEAMRFSIERMKRPDVGATLGAPAVWGQYLGGAEIVAEDKVTLRITLTEPMADLLDVLVSGYALPPHAADTAGFKTAPFGSGAYRIEKLEQGQEIKLASNPDWWGHVPGNPEIICRQESDATRRLTALLSGSCAIAARLGPGEAEELAKAPGFTICRHIDPTAIIYLLNTTKGPFRDPWVRRAVNLAVDRDALIDDVLDGGGQPLAGFISPAHFGSPPQSEPEKPDLESARRLLAEAVHGEGLILTVDCPTRLPDEAEALTAALSRQLAEIGVTLDVLLVEDRVAYAEQVRAKAIHDLCLFDSSPMSTYRVLREKIDSRVAGAWWQGYRNPEIEALIDTARITTAPLAREKLYRHCYEILLEDPAWLTLYNHTRWIGLAGDHPTWRPRADGILDIAGLPKLG